MPRQFRLSVRLSVRPSVTRVLCVKTAKRIIEIQIQAVAVFDQYVATRKR